MSRKFTCLFFILQRRRLRPERVSKFPQVAQRVPDKAALSPARRGLAWVHSWLLDVQVELSEILDLLWKD